MSFEYFKYNRNYLPNLLRIMDIHNLSLSLAITHFFEEYFNGRCQNMLEQGFYKCTKRCGHMGIDDVEHYKATTVSAWRLATTDGSKKINAF